jgi:hypothetical protein
MFVPPCHTLQVTLTYYATVTALPLPREARKDGTGGNSVRGDVENEYGELLQDGKRGAVGQARTSGIACPWKLGLHIPD